MNNENILEGIIIITTMHGEKLLGKYPLSFGENVSSRMEELMKAREPVTLTDVRKLLVQERVQIGQQGELQALQKISTLVPIDSAGGPLKSVSTLVSWWYLPLHQDEMTQRSVAELILQAERVETENRARLSGIIPAGQLPHDLRRAK